MEGNIFCLFDCRRNINTPFPKCWMIDAKCWSEKYFGIFCINYREHMQYPSLADAVPCVRHSKSVTLLPLFQSILVYPLHGWAPVQVWEAVGGVVRLDTTNTWPTACWRERASKNERDLAVFLGALAYFWSMRRVNEGTVCDFISFHSGKGEVSVIRDSWSWEHKQGPSFLHQAHTYQFIDFPCVCLCVYCWDKSQVWLFFLCSHSRLFYLWQQYSFILLSLSFPTKITLCSNCFSLLHSYFIKQRFSLLLLTSLM